MLHATNAARRVRSFGAPAAPAPSSRPGVALPYRSKLALTFRSVSEVGRAVGARIKGDVLGMLDGDSVSVLQIENKGAERSLADETLNLGSNNGTFHRDDPSHVYVWAS